MFENQINKIAKLLESNGYILLDGMSNEQINIIQDLYKITFPPELRELLMTFNPYQLYNWADLSEKNIAKMKNILAWPREGIIFDVKENSFWMDAWGKKPESIALAIDIVEYNLEQASPLIPIYSHRYIPSVPCEVGNPIFSVYQTDIIVCGTDLWDYFRIEFGNKNYEDLKVHKIKTNVPFWSGWIN
ncbi:SMI1/KNR4 family protein [Listeria sp. FSL L7-0091]|uniref:SMI1/KNR4 family protein n=1 Tax=Listeria farberi TaxID=2713500 RepID=A0A7X0ZJC5_9LIST|nr:SMI1/KNR4 family protein [Listeria farberi]MBC1376152.1 SMI1/KNR4 family protein [Listeria farberi]MBC1380231.1 SMI1/KNR4 family protein [Listeria farberi]MBC2262379.1 SMI1/KNR4 family protein [Listeria farberi]MBC2266461.1 SMI1/KNR4 family protein [Listeria farberi]MBC2288340.1 SMI1/KNR4 family protein [Listeria farberi]